VLRFESNCKVARENSETTSRADEICFGAYIVNVAEVHLKLNSLIKNHAQIPSLIKNHALNSKLKFWWWIFKLVLEGDSDWNSRVLATPSHVSLANFIDISFQR